MTPGIKRSIGEGFRAANRSWLGMGVVAASWMVVFIIAAVSVLLTRPPAELFQERASTEEVVAPAVTASAPTTPAPAGDSNEEPTLFNQLEATGQPASAPAQASVASPAPDTTERARQNDEERNRIVGDWLRHAWPVLALCVLLFLLANIWLYGGQIGYLAKQVTAPPTSLSEFLAAGARSFGALLGAFLLGLLAGIGFVLVIGFMGWLASLLHGALPSWIGTLLGWSVGLAILAGLIWAAVRLSFWFIAIVTDRRGPVAGLRASFRATRGHWWKLFGLIALFVLINIGVGLPLALLEAIGNIAGGGVALTTLIISRLLSVAANLYLMFASAAALIRFYEDTKAAPAGSAPVGQ